MADTPAPDADAPTVRPARSAKTRNTGVPPTPDPLPDGGLVDALAAAQAGFPAIPKTKTAKVKSERTGAEYSYSYADLADVLAAVRPVLAANGLAVTQHTDHATGVLTTVLRHRAGATLASTVELGQKSSNPQAFGGALTYLRRYELTTLLGIAAEEDSDAQHVPPSSGSSAPARAPELPAGLKPADAAAVRKVRAAVGELFDDHEAAGRFVDVLVEYSGGGLPSAASRALITIATRLGVDVNAALAAGEERAQAAAEADAVAAQQAAAEAPDTPAPDPGYEQETGVADPASPGDAAPDPSASDEPDEEEVANADPSPAADVDTIPMPAPEPERELPPPPEGYDRWPTGEQFIEDLAERTGGKVGLKDASAALKVAGCPCPDPLGLRGRRLVDDACPFLDHGIPF